MNTALPTAWMSSDLVISGMRAVRDQYLLQWDVFTRASFEMSFPWNVTQIPSELLPVAWQRNSMVDLGILMRKGFLRSIWHRNYMRYWWCNKPQRRTRSLSKTMDAPRLLMICRRLSLLHGVVLFYHDCIEIFIMKTLNYWNSVKFWRAGSLRIAHILFKIIWLI